MAARKRAKASRRPARRPRTEKPPYGIPSMEEVRGTEPNGLRVVSTFSGCGGSCLGYRMAGYRVLWANDMEPHAVDSYRRNFPGTVVDPRDVRTVRGEDVLRAAGLEPGELDLFDGSPPCQSFSSSGKRSVTDPRGTLFGDYARILGELRPRAFIAENVAGMCRGRTRGIFLETIKMLRDLGYRVRAKLLDAQWLGVPQTRLRLIFVGVREDVGRDPAFPDPLPYRYTLADACPWLAANRVSVGDAFNGGAKRRMEPATGSPAPTVLTGPGTVFVDGPASDVDGYGNPFDPSKPAPCIPSGRPWNALPVEAEAWVRGIVTDKWKALAVGESHPVSFNLVRMHPEKPAPAQAAIWRLSRTLNAAMVPHEPRKLSIAELKRVCSFPDDFELPGTYAQRWARMGNSVPPLMMRAIASAVRDGVLAP